MQGREVMFASGMEEKEVAGCHGQGQCRDTTYWCGCHEFIPGFRQIIQISLL